MRYFFIFFLVVSSLSYTNIANAYSCTPSTQYILSPPSLTAITNANVGDKIGTVVTSSLATAYTCTTSSMVSQQPGFRAIGDYAMTAADGTRIYKTNIDGIGYAIGGTSGNCNATGYVSNTGTKLLNDVDTIGFCDMTPNFATNVTARVNIQFYKIAETVGGGLVNGGVVGNVTMAVNGAFYPTSPSTITMSPFNVVNKGCTVNTPIINVPMGAVPLDKFVGIQGGKWSPDIREYEISLNCYKDTTIALRIDGDIVDASTGIINLNKNTSSATGVGIQILRNNSPLTLGTPVSGGGADVTGLYTIKLQARFIQTYINMTPGTAHASVTFTLLYP